jgi:uncharacterized protein (DUF58 family)
MTVAQAPAASVDRRAGEVTKAPSTRSWWPWARRARAKLTPAALGVYVEWKQLLALEFAARRVRWPPQNASPRSLLAGRNRSRVRGRGLDFIELRPYLPGDDTRPIDWRASARTGQAHVRVYAEERDRPTWLVVDQRISMFFARRGALASVVAAEAAAVWGWRALSGGDRVGGVVFGDDTLDDVPPQRGLRSMLHLLDRITARNHALRADTPVPAAPAQLDAALALLARYAPRGAVRSGVLQLRRPGRQHANGCSSCRGTTTWCCCPCGTTRPPR